MLSALRYGGLSVGGQLPILEVNPRDIQSVFRQLGRILNITGVLALVLILRMEYKAHEVSLLELTFALTGLPLWTCTEGDWSFLTIHGE